MNTKLSVIIPSYRDPLLHKTIDSLLCNSRLGDALEIIVSLDGYWPNPPLKDDPRVKVVHLGRNRGMRGAINAGVSIAKGDFLMRCDEHQIFGNGYDVIMARDCQPNWIMTPRRYFLDPVKWEVMDIPPVDFMKLKIAKTERGRKFSGVEAPGDDTQQIQESYAMQGSCWFMPHKWWDDVIGELQTEGYGPLIQDSHEMVFKTWKAGGKLMVDKNTWHAHKHRNFPRCHNNGTPENPANNEAGYAHALKVWEPYYNELVEQWNKPKTNDVTVLYYSSNRENPEFERKIQDNLLANCGGLPIISVTQKPVNLGQNICVGDVGHSYLNEFRQILIGAKAAKTEYLAFAEADFLYPKEYFDFRPNGGANIYRYNNVWIVFPREVAQSYRRKKYSEGAQFIKREYAIKIFEDILAGRPEWTDEYYKTRQSYHDLPYEWFGGEVPCLSFKTGAGVRKSTVTMDGPENRARRLPGWGHVEDVRKKFL